MVVVVFQRKGGGVRSAGRSSFGEVGQLDEQRAGGSRESHMEDGRG
jgi:hypothetical protein